jgi:hypothetical protein
LGLIGVAFCFSRVVMLVRITVPAADSISDFPAVYGFCVAEATVGGDEDGQNGMAISGLARDFRA